MTSTDVLRVKTIAALIEASDTDDPKDAAEVLRMIRALLEAGKEAK
jgi:hypothetical protein